MTSVTSVASVAVVTRALEEGSSYGEVLAALGLTVLAMPVTRTEPPADPDALVRALADDYFAIVISSARGAQALAAAHAIAPRPLPQVWAVGPATERALALAGITSHFPAGVFDAASLAQGLIAGGALHGKRVLVPRAEEGRDEGLAVLRGAGAIVDAVVAYRTVPVAANDADVAVGKATLLARRAAATIVFAPSQVRALGEILAPCPFAEVATRWIAIGETTATALRAHGLPVAVAASPTPAGIADAVRAVCSAAS